MEFPKPTLKELQKKYKDSSIRTLSNSIKKIHKEIFNVETYDPKLLYKYTKIIKWIKSNIEKQSSQKNLLAAILAFIKAEPDTPEEIISKYKEYFNTFAKKVETDRKYIEPTQKEKDNWIPYSDVKKKFNEIKKEIKKNKNKNLFQKYLALAFYNYLPPLRGEEYYNTVIINNCSDGSYENLLKLTKRNILDITNKKLVSYYYKTANVYGLRIIDLPKPLIDIVKESQILNDFNHFLFPNHQSVRPSPMSQPAFTNLLFRIFDPNKISTSMLRKIYISDILKKMKEPNKRKELAYIMGHSIDAQEFTYSRFKKIK